MAGSFSGHLIDSFLTAQQQSRGPFGQNVPTNPTISMYGPMSFAPQIHGTFCAQPQPPTNMPVYQDISEETAKQIATLQARLNKKLGPEYLSQRPGPGGGLKLTYAEGWKIINLANETFGFNGWSSSIVSLVTDYMDFNEQSQRYNVGVTAVVRVMLRDGVFHEDVGYGVLENSKTKGAALDKCKKEAVTDGVKRALRNFGNLLGNCLYDKAYTQEVIKIKVPPPKFDPSELHRRPEYDPNRTNAGPPKLTPSASSSAPAAAAGPSGANHPSTNQHAAHSIPPPPHARTVPGPPVPPNSSVKAKASMDLAEQSAPSRLPNTATSGFVKLPANPPAQSSNQNPPQQQQQQQQQQPKPTSQMNQDPKPQTVAYFSTSSAAEKRVSFAPALQSSVVGLSVAPPPPPPQPEPLVAQPNAKVFDDEESFGLNSEDDAFYATVDLGGAEADLGHPIDHDEGLDGLEDFDMTNCALSDVEDGPSVLGRYKPPPAPAPQIQPQQAAQSRASAPQQGRPGQVLQQHQRSSGQPSNSAAPPGQQSGSSNNQAMPPSQVWSGGFHFPSGKSLHSGKPPSGSGAGLKRSADAIREAQPVRRPAQGMGLSHAPGGRREPLATLEVADRGDFKRVRL